MARQPQSPVPSRRLGWRVPSGIASAALVAVLTACAPGPAAAPSSTASTPTATSTTATQADGPTLVADGAAEDNLPLFAAVTASVWATDDRAAGRAYVDALVQAGFDKSAMELTNDETTVGNPAESIQFSVQWGDKCLIGQVGPATGDPVTVVVPVLAEGTCLVGQTRPIDW